MSQLPPSDFRTAAVIASGAHPEAMRGATADPVARKFSCCLLAPEEGKKVQARAARLMLVAMIVFFVGLGAGAIIAAGLEAKHGGPNKVPLGPLLGAGACTFMGFAAAVGGLLYKRRMLARYLHERIGSQLNLTGKPVAVTIEDCRSFHKLKIKPEDSGILVPHKDVGCIRIEGLLCRYIIHGKDVTRIERIVGPNSEAAGVEYAIGPVRLKIGIQPMGLWQEVWRQIFRRKSPMIGMVCETLGIDPRAHGL